MKREVLWLLPVAVSAAVLAEADRRDVTPSELVADFFLERFPEFVADAIRRSIATDVLPAIEAEPAPPDEGGRVQLRELEPV